MSTVTMINDVRFRTKSGVEFEYIPNRDANELEISFGLDHYMLFEDPFDYEVEEWLRSFECGLTDEEIEDLGKLTDRLFAF